MASTSSFTSILERATARGANIVPGAILSAVDSAGKQVYHTVSGYNGISPTAAPLTEDATFWIASCTKLAASIAALQCVERGLLTLDEPVGKYLPELESPQIVSVGSDGEIKLTPARTKITLTHLLTHTSGLAYEHSVPLLQRWRKTSPFTSDPTGTVKQLYNVPLLFEPGTSWMYGVGIDWAGVIVERLNGNVSLGEYLHTNIFQRLGSEGANTTFRLHSPAAQKARIKERMMPNAQRQEDGSLIEKAYGFSEAVKEDSGGAGWYSTVGDYMVILQDLIAPEPKLLKKENLEKWLFRGHIADGKAVDALVTARTGMTPQEGSDVSGKPISYSLGGLIWETDGDVLPKGTLTWGGLPNLKWFANREKGLAAMFATQVTPSGDQQAQDLATESFKEVWRVYNSR